MDRNSSPERWKKSASWHDAHAKGLEYRIEIDGGVSLNNVAEIGRAGAEILVAGNAIFGKGDVKDNVKNLLKAANEAMLLKA